MPFICSPGVPEGAAPLPAAACWESVAAWVDAASALPVDEEVEPLELVHPAIMIPAMRIADAINITIMLFFMDYSPDTTVTTLCWEAPFYHFLMNPVFSDTLFSGENTIIFGCFFLPGMLPIQDR